MNSLMKSVKGGSASISVKPSSGGKRHSRKSHSSRKSHYGGSGVLNGLKNLVSGGEVTPADLNIFKGTGSGTPSSVGGKRRTRSHKRKHGGRKHSRSHRRKMRGGEGCSTCTPTTPTNAQM